MVWREGCLEEVTQVRDLVGLACVGLLQSKDASCEVLDEVGEDSQACRHVHRGPREVGETQLHNWVSYQSRSSPALQETHLNPEDLVLPIRTPRSRARVLERR